MLDEAESYWDILGSDAAAAVMTDEDLKDVEQTVDNLKAAHSLAKQCQERIFQKLKSLKSSKSKKKVPVSGSKVSFPVLSVDMSIESMLAQLPSGCKLELDRFNGGKHHGRHQRLNAGSACPEAGGSEGMQLA